MHIVAEVLPGAYLLQAQVHEDTRGIFVKTFHADSFSSLNIPFVPAEEFFTVSKKNVIRGMHFQTPPHGVDKVVYCTSGAVLDIIIDLRRGASYGKFSVHYLNAENRHVLYVPKGFAHGFLSLEDQTTLEYKCSAMYAPENDTGIRWNSFGYAWPVNAPIISDRDKGFASLKDYQTVF